MSWEQAEVVRLLKGQPGTQYQEGTDVDRTIIRDWIRSLLHATIVTVEFYKSDGSLRNMVCTLNTEHIPPAPIPPVIVNSTGESADGVKRKKKVTENLEKPQEETAIKVYDLEAHGWRSFRYDRLCKITATLSFE